MGAPRVTLASVGQTSRSAGHWGLRPRVGVGDSRRSETCSTLQSHVWGRPPGLPVHGASGPGSESETPGTSRSETCSTLQSHVWGRPPGLPVMGASGPGSESETPRTSRSETCSTLQSHVWDRPPGLPVHGASGPAPTARPPIALSIPASERGHSCPPLRRDAHCAITNGLLHRQREAHQMNYPIATPTMRPPIACPPRQPSPAGAHLPRPQRRPSLGSVLRCQTAIVFGGESMPLP